MVPKQIKAVKKLENELVKKHPYEQLSVDELLGFIDIIQEASLFGKKIGEFEKWVFGTWWWKFIDNVVYLPCQTVKKS